MKKRNSLTLMLTVVSILVSCIIMSCKKNDLVTATTTDVNIYSYLRKDTVKFSQFVKIIDKSGFGEFLDAYGSYTCFAPDNAGVNL